MKLYEYIQEKHKEIYDFDYCKAPFQETICNILTEYLTHNERVHIAIPRRYGITFILTCFQEWTKYYYSRDICIIDLDDHIIGRPLGNVDIIAEDGTTTSKFASKNYRFPAIDHQGESIFPKKHSIEKLREIEATDPDFFKSRFMLK